MARPKGTAGKATNLYLPPELIEGARRLAFQKNQSLSQFVADLIESRIKRHAAATGGAK
jgi:hypothetical protein